MNRAEMVQTLIDMLLEEMPGYRALAAPNPRALLRGLMNLRPPRPPRPEFLALQDALLQGELAERGVVDGEALPTGADARLALWQGDITRLKVDAIVNAANSALLGCFVPCHGCIDNAIHSAAGLQLRQACAELMRAQGREEPAGRAQITPGFNLPCRYVLHTVGPIVQGPLTDTHRRQLASCYRACLDLAAQRGLASVAFCCISTGEFHFPPEAAADVAIDTVRAYLARPTRIRKVIFNVFKDRDRALYRQRLS
ncbi:MAG: protein-ADP-ribose hydrolase [Christensenellales bacterium]|jgi:O-acetyl-ADP-ribose deacetylase (regulator of RNase III)